jgi:hypothetical protein
LTLDVKTIIASSCSGFSLPDGQQNDPSVCRYDVFRLSGLTGVIIFSISNVYWLDKAMNGDTAMSPDSLFISSGKRPKMTS